MYVTDWNAGMHVLQYEGVSLSCRRVMACVQPDLKSHVQKDQRGLQRFFGSFWAQRFAFAYDDVNGVIEKIDIPSRQLVLDGERTYPVARGINLAKYKVGDKIALRIEDEGTKKGVVMKIILGEYFPASSAQTEIRGNRQHSMIALQKSGLAAYVGIIGFTS